MDDPQQEQQPPQPVSPQRRLQELRAIPERDRTDAQWDELNEIEIALASANRAGGPNPNQNPGGHNQHQQRRDGGRRDGKPGGGGNQQRHHRPPNRGRPR
jgi:hypothetical protein